MGNYDENDYNVDDDITTDDIDDDHNDYKDNDDGAVRRDLRCWRWPRSIIHMLQNKLCFHNQINKNYSRIWPEDDLSGKKLSSQGSCI